MASITTSRGASMDPEEVKRALQNDPSLFQQFMGMLGLGGGQAQQANPQVTGDIGMNPVVTGNVGANAPVGTGSVRLTGDVGDTSASRAGGGGSSSIPPMGSASGRTAPSGAGGGGGGRPPVTGTGAPAPAPGGGGQPGINLAGLRNQARASQTGQSLLANTGRTTLRGAGLALAGRYSPLIGGGLALMQGDVLGAVGSVGGGLLGGLVGGAPGAIAGSVLGGGAAKALAGGASKALEAVTGQRREEGKSGLTGSSVPGLKPEDLQAAEFLRRGGIKNAEEMLPFYRQYRDVDAQNQMRLNQQLGQLTGALNRQMYAAQLAGGAQQQAGQTVRDIITSSNPYAASVFRG